MSSSSLRRLAIACLVLLAGCADPGPGIDLELVVDPNVAPREEVLAQVALYRVVLDAPSGLYLPGQERVSGNLEIRDFDSDPSDLEVVVTVPAIASRLPWIRIERGGLPDVPMEVRVLGYDLDTAEGVVIAEGILRGVRFGSGLTTWQMSFNLLPDRLPPRVEDAVVGDGTGIGCGLPFVVVLFSKPVDAASLSMPGSVTFEPGGAPSSLMLDPTRRIAQISAPTDVVGAEGYAFTLTLGTTIVDDEGRSLDQVPTVPGDQAFVRSAMARCQRAGGLLGP